MIIVRLVYHQFSDNVITFVRNRMSGERRDPRYGGPMDFSVRTEQVKDAILRKERVDMSR